MLNHIRMGKLAGWRPRGHHERVRESYMMNFVKWKRGDRGLPYRLSADRKRNTTISKKRNINSYEATRYKAIRLALLQKHAATRNNEHGRHVPHRTTDHHARRALGALLSVVSRSEHASTDNRISAVCPRKCAPTAFMREASWLY